MTSSWFFLSTLNYDARSTTHQIYNHTVVFMMCVISDPRREVAKNCALLGYYAANSGFLNPKDGAEGLFRNVGKNHRYSLRNNPRESSYILLFIFMMYLTLQGTFGFC